MELMKSELVTTVKTRITEKISHLENLISQTRESNTETKSSMGDKYETGREMVQQEINNLQRQLNETFQQQESVKRLNGHECQNVDFGALVETNIGLFYISTAVGEIKMNGKKIITVSPESPLAKAMHGKKAGEEFIVNNLKQTIRQVW